MRYAKFYNSWLYVLRHPVKCYRNYRLVKKYPFLLPRYGFADETRENYHYQDTELDHMPEGWRKTFGKMMMDDLVDACKKDKIDIETVRILDLKEKYGMWRMDLNVYEPNIQKVLDAYEEISQHVCWRCGKIDVPLTNFGWIVPECRSCYLTYHDNARHYDKMTEGLSPEDCRIPNYYTTHIFGENGSQYVNNDLTWITDRLRNNKEERERL